MARRPPLPKSELEIVRIVWDLKEATVRQVLDALPADRKVEFWTVQTYLRRLKAKKYLKSRREGRTDIYSPCVSPDRVVSDVVSDFLNRVFDGQTLPLFQHLIHERGLSDDEINRLQETLNELKKEAS
jgi:predicted transcriptional regulator